MLSEVRPIYFRTEFIFLPFSENPFDKKLVRDLYNHLTTPGEGFLFENINMQDDVPTLSTERSDGILSCEVGPDFIAIEEDPPEAEVTSFIETVQAVLSGLASIRKWFPPLVAQKTIVRGIAQPNQCEHSIELLADKLSRVMDKIGPFRRPPAFLGLRFSFPPRSFLEGDEIDEEVDDSVVNPGSPKGEIEEAPDQQESENASLASYEGTDPDGGGADEDFIDLTFQTWRRDVKQVSMEVASRRSFSQAFDVLEEEDRQRLCDNVETVYDFMKLNAVEFLNQFDKAPGDEP